MNCRVNRWKRAVPWAVFGCVIVGIGIYLIATDLDRADKLASVVGGLAGVVGLTITLFSVRRQPAVPVAAEQVPTAPSSSDQSPDEPQTATSQPAVAVAAEQVPTAPSSSDQSPDE